MANPDLDHRTGVHPCPVSPLHPKPKGQPTTANSLHEPGKHVRADVVAPAHHCGLRVTRGGAIRLDGPGCGAFALAAVRRKGALSSAEQQGNIGCVEGPTVRELGAHGGPASGDGDGLDLLSQESPAANRESVASATHCLRPFSASSSAFRRLGVASSLSKAPRSASSAINSRSRLTLGAVLVLRRDGGAGLACVIAGLAGWRWLPGVGGGRRAVFAVAGRVRSRCRWRRGVRGVRRSSGSRRRGTTGVCRATRSGPPVSFRPGRAGGRGVAGRWSVPACPRAGMAAKESRAAVYRHRWSVDRLLADLTALDYAAIYVDLATCGDADTVRDAVIEAVRIGQPDMGGRPGTVSQTASPTIYCTTRGHWRSSCSRALTSPLDNVPRTRLFY
jgi:hypothetical protein